ncbi:Exodeoxyribonuclease V alpha chain [Methylophaga frappieri]|uniref:RecBCD enzyme subunit RecD n=1 Tax=Methylophaga frappieri (strain ATCC BAA-2434 / DSM 25690 / JAM7) TaxID=754477 RepID=I1YH94_METFJ|nr:exodeoxyribonuclease V subunit alpha [Methylophaga frappieri]AFJ02287.1 Exodeoxyribonuclease V alpha chain [Methylophaga frappieri]
MFRALSLLRQCGFSEIACQFADFIERKTQGEPLTTSLTAGLLTEAVSQGHVCLNLHQVPAVTKGVSDYLPEQVATWTEILKTSRVVGEPGEYRPLILTDAGQVYLYRFWLDERDVASLIRLRLKPVENVDFTQLNQDLINWKSHTVGTDWQKVAVAMAVSRQFGVISGGPGTGKTSIVLKILQCLEQQSNSLQIGLAAPTGKAAARLQQAIRQPGYEVKTLHRLLGITEQNHFGRYNHKRTLPLDVLIIDEASMIDISLMAKLMRAMSEQTRLILLGDSQQLASVESGAVLANLSEGQQGVFSDTFIEQFSCLGLEKASSNTPELLIDSFVRLKHSYRFSDESAIGKLSQLINQGDSGSVINILTLPDSDISWRQTTSDDIHEVVTAGYQAYIETVENQASHEKILHAFERYRVLSALRQGPQSVASINQMMSRYLGRRGWRAADSYYVGRPILITQNQYRQQLFNGDIGIVLPDETGQLKACFKVAETFQWVSLNRLPAHETVFAMTIHKSQGSEFDEVSVLLPDEFSPVLNRELLYTALTRAREKVAFLSSELTLRQTIETRHHRESGLSEQLGING